MNRELYKAVIRYIDSAEFNFKDTFTGLKENFPNARPESLRSILTQTYSREVRKNYSSQTSEIKRKEYCDTFEKSLRRNVPKEKLGCTIIYIAKKNRFSSALTAKIILSARLNLDCNDSESKKLVNKQVSELLKNTNLISNGRLALEVWKACLEDENYGHYSECIKSAVGNEYEKRLKQKLRHLGISFQVKI